MFFLHPASQTDLPAIRALISAVQINPLGLNWQRFVVAISKRGELVGCGQIKLHYDGSQELASIAVAPEWRGRGVAKAVIENLLKQSAEQGPLYLTCRAGLEPFYERFDFQPIEAAAMPPYFQRIYRLARFFQRLGLMKESLLVMKRAGYLPGRSSTG